MEKSELRKLRWKQTLVLNAVVLAVAVIGFWAMNSGFSMKTWDLTIGIIGILLLLFRLTGISIPIFKPLQEHERRQYGSNWARLNKANLISSAAVSVLFLLGGTFLPPTPNITANSFNYIEFIAMTVPLLLLINIINFFAVREVDKGEPGTVQAFSPHIIALAVVATAVFIPVYILLIVLALNR